MPRYIIKPLKEDDFYVEFSSIVDSIVSFGSRREMIKHIEEERLNRADIHGTSGFYDENHPVNGWNEEEIGLRESIIDKYAPEHAFWGWIQRKDIKSFCKTLNNGYFFPPKGMLRWEVLDEN